MLVDLVTSGARPKNSDYSSVSWVDQKNDEAKL